MLTAVRAYDEHLHLVIRPEDVWFAILTQLRLYTNGHAEEVRGSFVSHQGQKELEIKSEGGSRTYDCGHMATRMATLMEMNFIDPTMRAWVQPNFTHTTKKNVTTASIMMMGALGEVLQVQIHYHLWPAIRHAPWRDERMGKDFAAPG